MSFATPPPFEVSSTVTTSSNPSHGLPSIAPPGFYTVDADFDDDGRLDVLERFNAGPGSMAPESAAVYRGISGEGRCVDCQRCRSVYADRSASSADQARCVSASACS